MLRTAAAKGTHLGVHWVARPNGDATRFRAFLYVPIRPIVANYEIGAPELLGFGKRWAEFTGFAIRAIRPNQRRKDRFGLNSKWKLLGALERRDS